MLGKSASLKRLRGVVLSDSGWERLQTIKQRLQAQNSGGEPWHQPVGMAASNYGNSTFQLYVNFSKSTVVVKLKFSNKRQS